MRNIRLLITRMAGGEYRDHLVGIYDLNSKYLAVTESALEQQLRRGSVYDMKLKKASCDAMQIAYNIKRNYLGSVVEMFRDVNSDVRVAFVSLEHSMAHDVAHDYMRGESGSVLTLNEKPSWRHRGG